MNPKGEQILRGLQTVAAERALRAADPAPGCCRRGRQGLPAPRFEATYADMLAHPRFGRAARFFLDDLYGPMDFTQRDDQFARIVPGLVRLFPADIVSTVAALADLHALSETLDSQMARALGATALDGADVTARPGAPWASRPQRESRSRLMLAVGTALDRYTRNPLLRHSLRLMRGPAQAAGLGVLQAFLERGFDTFGEMRGAASSWTPSPRRERELAAHLFAGGDVPEVTPPPPQPGPR
jgi:hypothetical protein